MYQKMFSPIEGASSLTTVALIKLNKNQTKQIAKHFKNGVLNTNNHVIVLRIFLVKIIIQITK